MPPADQNGDQNVDELSSSKLRQVRRVGFLVFTLAMTALLVKLGYWQMSRAEEKVQLLMQLDVRQQTVLTAIAEPNADMKGFGVALQGQFESTQSILLDNQTLNGQVGYRWMVPFTVDGKWLLVELGWVAAPARRDELPKLPLLPDTYVVHGVLDAPSDRMVLSHDITEKRWPLRVQSIDMDALSVATGKSVFPWIVRSTRIEDVQGNTENINVTPVWTPVVMLPEKHYAYAVQWFGLAIVVAVGSLVWWRKGRL
ncbi:Cytochrome oxidase assembly protein ShyY1 [Enterovibrio nigricans DSM 22720]|uniref:SURF1-like protein n=1 Tax=Enterovibrio nigricans DSM 22720 TaxID=1121868 RepID=A0A1T4UGT1_9GAMM|nr:Cytochrome oxidase assembly protein ShyY1 [Enterovibrio nigricans DSM 22720]